MMASPLAGREEPAKTNWDHHYVRSVKNLFGLDPFCYQLYLR